MSAFGARQNRICCYRCDEPIEGWCETRRYGGWDSDAQNYEGTPIETRLCRECWNDDEGRASGAHFYPDSAEQLYRLLDAAGGELAAILCWWSGRPAVRVVDGEVQGAVTKPRRGGESPDGTPIIKFESELIEDFDRDEFNDTAEPPEKEGFNLVRLVSTERTPFGAIEGEGE